MKKGFKLFEPEGVLAAAASKAWIKLLLIVRLAKSRPMFPIATLRFSEAFCIAHIGLTGEA